MFNYRDLPNICERFIGNLLEFFSCLFFYPLGLDPDPNGA